MNMNVEQVERRLVTQNNHPFRYLERQAMYFDFLLYFELNDIDVIFLNQGQYFSLDFTEIYLFLFLF